MAEQIPPTNEPAPDEGAVHGGDRPRFRRTVRSAAIAGALLFFILLAILTSRYGRGTEPTAPGEASPPPVASRPLSAERIDRYAQELLAEELRARKRPAGPPDLGPAPPERPPEGPGVHAGSLLPPVSAARGRSPRGRGEGGGSERRLSAIRSGLIPAGASGGSRGLGVSSGTGTASGSSNPVRTDAPPPGPPLPGFEELRRTLSGISEAPEEARSPLSARTVESGRGEAVELSGPRVHRLLLRPAPAVPDRLYAGTVVPLVLAHDVATDVPGPVRAVVARDVFDSFTHRRLLIPRGALVIGHQAAYSTGGDERVLIAWQELKLPSGETLLLPDSPAGSPDGSAGVRGQVDGHWWSRFGSAAALSLVGAGVQLAQPQRRTSVDGFAPSEGQILAQQLGLELGRLSQEILRRGVDRPPTITLRAGQSLSLLVTAELAFPR